MGVYLRAVAVLQRRHDAATVGVVLRVGRGHHVNVQGQPYAVALNLHVSLFHQVEQPHLYPLGQVGQLVDAEDAPVGAGHQTVVDHQFVRKVMPLRHLDGVNLANQVGDGDVGGSQLLRVALLAGYPLDGRIVALFGHTVAAGLADGVVGVVVNFATRYLGNVLVQQPDQAAYQARFGLPPLAQQDDVLPGQDGVLQLRNYRFLESDDAGKDDFLGANPSNQIGAYFFADGANYISAFAQVANGSQGAVISHQ